MEREAVGDGGVKRTQSKKREERKKERGIERQIIAIFNIHLLMLLFPQLPLLSDVSEAT